MVKKVEASSSELHKEKEDWLSIKISTILTHGQTQPFSKNDIGRVKERLRREMSLFEKRELRRLHWYFSGKSKRYLTGIEKGILQLLDDNTIIFQTKKFLLKKAA